MADGSVGVTALDPGIRLHPDQPRSLVSRARVLSRLPSQPHPLGLTPLLTPSPPALLPVDRCWTITVPRREGLGREVVDAQHLGDQEQVRGTAPLWDHAHQRHHTQIGGHRGQRWEVWAPGSAALPDLPPPVVSTAHQAHSGCLGKPPCTPHCHCSGHTCPGLLSLPRHHRPFARAAPPWMPHWATSHGPHFAVPTLDAR